MKIILIASVSKNGFIGQNNNMMWNLPNDLKRFKNITLCNYILMGRKTFESIGKILPGRVNIIFTKKNFHKFKKKEKKNLKVISSIRDINKYFYDKKIFVIGGEKIYNLMIQYAYIIELTLVHHNFNGNKKFPKIDIKQWIKTYEVFNKKNKNHLYDYSFIRFNKKNIIQ